MKSFKTAADIIRYIAKNYSKPNALNFQNETAWSSFSSQDLVEQIKYTTLALKALGVNKGDCIGLLALSSPKWTIVDLAIMALGGVTVPLFGNISSENFEFEVKQTELKTILVSGEEQTEMLIKHKEYFQNIIDLEDKNQSWATLNYKNLLEMGKAEEEKYPFLFDELLDAIHPDDLATIVYTSGSTGVPKGVMLTHKNSFSIIHINPFSWDQENDIYLSILPLAHIFARTLNFIMVAWGIPIYYIKDIKTVGDVCRELHPTLLVLVPRLLEKIYAKMCDKVNSAGFLKKTIGNWAFDLANSEDGLYKKIMHPLADKIVYSTLRESLGGNLRVVISGGAPLNPHLYSFFLAIGVPLHEGWGLTEAAAVTCNLPGKTKIGTVGIPFEGLQVKTSDKKELLVYGDIVMTGYFKNEEATKKTFTEEGWLKTGDLGSVDDEGFVTILGRDKEMYKTSTGEYIAPVPIEQNIAKAPLIETAMIVAEGKKYASCLIFPDFDVLKNLKRSYNNEHLTDEEFLHSKAIKKEMDLLFEEVNQHLNHWEQIHAYRFILTPPTIEGGELTPTMKIRRENILKKYEEIINNIYEEKDV